MLNFKLLLQLYHKETISDHEIKQHIKQWKDNEDCSIKCGSLCHTHNLNGSHNIKWSTITLTVWVKKTSTSKATDDDSLKGIYKLSNRWVIVRPIVQTNGTKCDLQRILIYVSGLKLFELFIHSSPHMLNSSYCNKPSSLWRRGMNLFIFLVKKGPALYLTSSVLPVFQVLTCTA